MAVVQSLGVAKGDGGGSVFRVITMLLVMNAGGVLRADVDTGAADEWVSPVSLDEVPLRFPDAAGDVLPSPLVVPLPTGLEGGAACLAGMAAARWWKRGRRRSA